MGNFFKRVAVVCAKGLEGSRVLGKVGLGFSPDFACSMNEPIFNEVSLGDVAMFFELAGYEINFADFLSSVLTVLVLRATGATGVEVELWDDEVMVTALYCRDGGLLGAGALVALFEGVKVGSYVSINYRTIIMDSRNIMINFLVMLPGIHTYCLLVVS